MTTHTIGEDMNINEISWPNHLGGLHIVHNDHKSNYITVQQAIERNYHGYDPDDFPDAEELAIAIATDSVWMIQWYPDTPVGFYNVSAATFERALEYALNQ